jgi:hypothetical protein
VFVPTADPIYFTFIGLYEYVILCHNKKENWWNPLGKIDPYTILHHLFFPYDQNIIPQTINSQIMRHRQRFDIWSSLKLSRKGGILYWNFKIHDIKVMIGFLI